MTLRQFIQDNRAELDQCIARALGREKNPRPNDEERRLWILNDEGLYRDWETGTHVRQPPLDRLHRGEVREEWGSN